MMSGSLWDLLVGLLFFNPRLGVAAGAAAGGIGGALSDFGIPEDFMKEVAALSPGKAALFMIVRHIPSSRVASHLADFDGTVLRTNLSSTDQAKLRAHLDATREEEIG